MALGFITLGLTPSQFLGSAFWIGFTLHLLIAETWIHGTRENKKEMERV
jgi:hypothetical protein